MGVVIGIDGARGGWVGCRLDGSTFEIVCFRDHELAHGPTHELTYELAAGLRGVDHAWIDMPLGLPQDQRDFPRRCDVALRQRLGRRASSVFTCPIRPAVYAQEYREACRLNAEATGKKISLQAWNICPKIRQLDQLLQSKPPIRFRESHPEYNFQCLKGESLKHAKKTPEGRQERLEGVIRVYHPELAEHIATTRFRVLTGVHVSMDDILDAAVLAVSAQWALTHGEQRLPLEGPGMPPLDAYGIPMQIVAPLVKKS
jgi:predicted RNase H-like nuclease